MATVMSMWLIGLAVTFAALLVAAWRLFNWIKSGSYLLSSKYIVESPSPVVIDQNERNAVLRQEYSPEKVPQNLDAIVIGSGIGGLSAAVFLARAGKKVLVLERNYRAGGMCSSFNSKNGVEFDIGLYNFGFLHDKSNPFTITFNHLTKGKVGFDKIPGTCDRVVIGSVKDCPRYEGFGGPLFQNLLRILKYTAFKYQDQSLMKVINDAGVQDQKLRATMEYITAMAGLDATTCSYITFSLILWCYNAPSYYPTGGANEIPFHLIPQIEEAGGRVLVNACVNQILFSDDGKAQGVKVVPTNAEDASENDHRIYAPVVVSDAGIMNTFQRGLVPDHIARKSRYYKYCQDVGPSDSYFHVMVVLDGTADELGLEPNMLWYVKDTDTMEHPELSRKMDIDRQITEDIAWFGSSCHSAKDSSWNDRFPGKSAMQLGFSCDYEGLKKYEGKNGVRVNADEYNASKETLGRKAWDKFCEYYPKCRSRVEQFEVGSALTYNRHLNTVKGELYGLDHSMARTRPVAIAEMRSKTDIPGLYLTGTDSFFCSIPAVAWSGLACACEILGYKALAAMLFVTDKSPILRTWILGY